jgi:predicted ribosome quality control (RQC) complex YloA/Tae2 family protein
MSPSEHRGPSPIKSHDYVLSNGWTVRVGRTDQDNDRLSLKIAKANDWWFHVKGRPGSHAILQVPSGEEPSKSILEEAAAVAAYHSKVRDANTASVVGTQARFVSKPKGSKPGTVTIRKERTFVVRPAIPSV